MTTFVTPRSILGSSLTHAVRSAGRPPWMARMLHSGFSISAMVESPRNMFWDVLATVILGPGFFSIVSSFLSTTFFRCLEFILGPPAVDLLEKDRGTFTKLVFPFAPSSLVWLFVAAPWGSLRLSPREGAILLDKPGTVSRHRLKSSSVSKSV